MAPHCHPCPRYRRSRLILYEYPINERIRTLLRLEDLFDRFMFFLSRDDPREHHAALTTLFEIAEVAGRTDLKSDLLKELEKQRQTLSALRGNPHVEAQQLEDVLASIEQALNGLNQQQGKGGQHLAENEWLVGIRSRAAIPGGVCRFDLPSYFAWQHNPAELRRSDLTKWVTPLLPIREASAIVLRLARSTGQSAKEMARAGNYQQMLSGRTFQLVQIRLLEELNVVPKASANKYLLWIQFNTQDSDGRPRQVETDVPFQLTLCSL
jgi:cell division protein ZapD